MKHGTILLIFLIPALGIAALFWQLSGAEALSLWKIGSISFVLFAAVILGRRARIGQISGSRSTKARVIGARVGDGIGELTVEAMHSSDVSAIPNMPLNSRIVTIKANQLYRVEIPYAKRAVIEGVARSVGYRGEVG